MNLKQILVPLDGSETSLHSLKYASDLAKQCQASVLGLHVMLYNDTLPRGRVEKNKWPNYVKDLMKEAQNLAEKRDLDFAQMIINGKNPGIEILTFAENKTNKIDLIVMGRRGLSFPKEIFFGSTANLIVQKSKIPVLLTR